MRLPGMRGVTMVELVVALGLLGSVWLAVFGLMRFVLLGIGLAVDRLEVQQNARVAVEKVAEELRWAGEVVADVACGASGLCTNRVTARVPPNNPRRPGEAYDVTFRRDVVQRELERRVGGGTSNLAGLVEELRFRYADAAGAPAASADAVVRIEMTMTVSPSSGVTAGSRTLTTAILLRNRPIPSWPSSSRMAPPLAASTMRDRERGAPKRR